MMKPASSKLELKPKFFWFCLKPEQINWVQVWVCMVGYFNPKAEIRVRIGSLLEFHEFGFFWGQVLREGRKLGSSQVSKIWVFSDTLVYTVVCMVHHNSSPQAAASFRHQEFRLLRSAALHGRCELELCVRLV